MVKQLEDIGGSYGGGSFFTVQTGDTNFISSIANCKYFKMNGRQLTVDKVMSNGAHGPPDYIGWKDLILLTEGVSGAWGPYTMEFVYGDPVPIAAPSGVPPVWRDTWENYATVCWGYNSDGVHDYQATGATQVRLMSPLPKRLSLAGASLQARAAAPIGTYPGPIVRAINGGAYTDRQMGPITVR